MLVTIQSGASTQGRSKRYYKMVVCLEILKWKQAQLLVVHVITLSTGKSTGGEGASITLSVGDGKTGIGGNVIINAGVHQHLITVVKCIYKVVKVPLNQVVLYQ